MSPERWAQIDQLLAQALECPAAKRTAFLLKACGGDAALRAEVESLLQAHQEAEADFLNTPALEEAVRNLAQQQSQTLPDSALTRQSLVGATFGRYRVLSVLGVGGMGEVYLALDERLQRKVALKLLPAQFTQDAARIKRFEREARAASALSHPNIITIYEIGQTDGKHFIAAEYVEGQTLRTLLADGPLPLKQLLEIATQAAAALLAAHEAGIIHRDIKPENLMLRPDGYLKVLDFGLAKLIEQQHSDAQTRGSEDLARTNPGAVLGTVRYMSPEQALGQEVDQRSDLFSLGVLLYELATGVPPFKGDTTAATLDAIVHHPPLPVGTLRVGLPVEFERLLNRCLEKDCDLRYQTASDLHADLKRLNRELEAIPTAALQGAQVRHAGLPGRALAPEFEVRWLRWLDARGLSTATLLVAILGFLGLRFGVGLPVAPSPWLSAATSLLTDFPGEERNPSLSPDGKEVYYARVVNGQWDIFRQRLGGGNALNLTLDSAEADDEQPACSPDGTFIAFRSSRQGGGLFMMGPNGENVRKVASFGQNPAWSPDSTQLVCGTDFILDPRRRSAQSKLFIINVADGRERVLVEKGDAAQPKWSPDRQRIAYFYRDASNQADIWTIGADGSNPTRVTNDAAVDWNPVWSNDGNYLYFASNRKSVASLWRIRIKSATGEPQGQPQAVTGQSAEVLQMDLSRDGRQLVYVTRIQDANIKSIGYEPAKKMTVGDSEYVTRSSRPSGSPHLSPDGQWVAFHTLGAPQEDIWLVRSDGSGNQINLTNDAYLDRSPRWSPNGKRLAFFSNRTGKSQIWLINADGSNLQQLTFDPAGCQFPFWSPDGQRLGYQSRQSNQGTLIIEIHRPWEQQTPVQLPPVSGTNQWFNGFTWSPDGKFIAGHLVEWQGREVREPRGIWIYAVATRQYQQLTDFGFRPEWLPDSRHLIFSNHGTGALAQQKLWLVDSQTKVTKPLLPHPTVNISTLGVTPDSRRIFYTATDHQSDLFLVSLDK